MHVALLFVQTALKYIEVDQFSMHKAGHLEYSNCIRHVRFVICESASIPIGVHILKLD